jgi:hypothetical protein
MSVEDTLNGVPGLLTVQHAGGGKASQWFLRGFDADHGTDLALFVDDVPVNLPSHGHGQGYSDLHWVIPELVEAAEVRKGPYFADLGDFGTAGAIQLRLVDRVPESRLTVAGGRFGTFRALGVFGTESRRTRTVFAAELFGENGPFANAEELRRLNLFGRVSFDLPHGVARLTATSYASGWDASGQLPLRAIESGLVGRFGNLDPYEGGASQRHALSFDLVHGRARDRGELRLTLFVVHYRFELDSDFTFFSADPVDGDMIRQSDARTFAGGRASHELRRRWGELGLVVRAGAQARFDAIDNRLDHAPRRVPIANVVDARIGESGIGLFGEADLRWSNWFEAVVGLRADHALFQVDDRRDVPPAEAGSGSRQAMIVSPKAQLIFRPHASLALTLAAGSGFHSNDARGVLARAAPADPFARAIGYEAGVRYELADRLALTVTGYVLDLASEVVWVGDEGTTEPSGRTRRVGAELGARATILEWLESDVAFQWSRGRFRDAPAGEDLIPLAPAYLLTAGLRVAHPAGFSGRLGLTWLGDRPATEDGVLEAEGFVRLDLTAEYRHPRFGLGLMVQNLTNTAYRTAQFATTSRLQGEAGPNDCPAGTRAVGAGAAFEGCEDLSFTPGWPVTVLGSASVFF